MGGRAPVDDVNFEGDPRECHRWVRCTTYNRRGGSSRRHYMSREQGDRIWSVGGRVRLLGKAQRREQETTTEYWVAKDAGEAVDFGRGLPILAP